MSTVDIYVKEGDGPVVRPSIKDLLELFPKLEDTDPGLMKRLYPRRYRHVKGYEDGPKLWATWMSSILSHLHYKRNLDSNDTIVSSYVIAERLTELKVPTYFIAHDVMELLMATDPPLDIKFSDLKMPVDAFLMVMPDCINKFMPPGTKLATISCRVVPEMWVGNPHCYLVDGSPHRPFKSENTHEVFVMHATIEERGQVCDYNQQIRRTESVSALLGQPCEYYSVQPTSREEDTLVQKVILFATVHVLLLFNADPHCFERPVLANQPRHHTDGKLISHGVWHPNYIGRQYRKPSAPQGGHHASPTAHIRRSHWHTYWAGRGRTEKRVKWVLWTHVNLKKDQPI